MKLFPLTEMKTLHFYLTPHFPYVSKDRSSQEIFSQPSVLIGFTSSREMAQAASETGIVLHLMLLEPGVPQQRSDQLQEPVWGISGFESLSLPLKRQ